MVYIPPEFTPAVLKDEDKYEGKEVDKHVLETLPKGTEIEWVSTHGATHWCVSTKIDALVNGEQRAFFVKEYRDTNAAEMAQAEYEATKALYEATPKHIPEPIGHGSYFSDESKYFYVQGFRDMSDELPDVDELASILANIHKKLSPNGKFGFHIPTFQGNIRFDNQWCDTWEECFVRIFRSMLENERRIQGPSAELDAISEDFITKVIPRLLRPLETDGNKIEPVLLHADLWHGNVGVDNETDEPVFYDPGTFYGHGEYDLGTMRATRYRFNRAHVRAYHKLVPISEPVEDHDDRNALYCCRNDLQVSCCWKENKMMRQLAIDEMKRLLQKYPEGYEGYQKRSNKV